MALPPLKISLNCDYFRRKNLIRLFAGVSPKHTFNIGFFYFYLPSERNFIMVKAWILVIFTLLFAIPIAITEKLRERRKKHGYFKRNAKKYLRSRIQYA